MASASPVPSSAPDAIEKGHEADSNAETSSPKVATFDFSSIDEKKLIRKLDWALVPWVSSETTANSIAIGN